MSSEARSREERWRQISRLFAIGRTLPAAELEDWLDRETSGDEEVRREVLRLVERDRKPGGVLEEGWMPSPAPAPQEPFLDSSSGRYEVLEEIGRGGMGTVYRARRKIAGTEQIVALKMILPGMDTRLVVRRFERERSLLAGLEHPSIARLLDAGETPLGRPFMVMEHVNGERIDGACDRGQIPVERRIELMLEVCEAVEHAHRKLVVHRDLKPSNVLVTRDGRIKLLDFGMSKLLGSDREQEPTVSVAGLRWVTPSYASPELLAGREVTTAVDVYGLGALLYALLTGSPPRSSEAPDPEAAAETVMLPSRRIDEGERPLDEIARDRGVDGTRLRRRLHGDLDNILLKALDPDPGRRYGSARELADDLRRHREGLPVRARAATLGYRAARFLRRHWRGVALAATLLFVLVAALAAVSWQARVALGDRQTAQLEAAKAEEVTEFLVELIAEVDPDQSQGSELTMREVMDQGEDRLRRELGDRPEVRAALLRTLGLVNRKLGRWQKAERVLDEAYRESQRLHGPGSAEVAECLEEMGWVAQETKEPLRALQHFRRAHSIRSSIFGEKSIEAADTLAGLARVARIRGDVATAHAHAQARHETLHELAGPSDPRTINSLIELGSMEGELGNYRLSVDLLGDALAELEARPESNAMDAALVTAELSRFHLKLGEIEEGLRYGRWSMSFYERLLGPDHIYVGIAASNVGLAESRARNFDTAQQLLERALGIFEKELGPENLSLAVAVHNLGLLGYRSGDRPEATARFREALAIYDRVVGREHIHPAVTGHYLGVMAREDGDFDRAEEMFSWVLRVRRELLEPDHPRLAATLHELGILRIAQGRLEEGERRLREAFAIRRRSLAPDHLELAGSWLGLARVDCSRQDLSAAAEKARRALEIRRLHLGEEEPEVVSARRLLEDIPSSQCLSGLTLP